MALAGDTRARASAAVIAVLCLAVFPTSRLPAQVPGSAESLLVAARRAARAWQGHDFAALLSGSPGVLLQIPGTNPSAPLRPSQAAELLRAYVEGTAETEVEVTVARRVDEQRAYVEIQRTFTVRGTATRRTQTLYVGMMRSGETYRVVEVRIVP